MTQMEPMTRMGTVVPSLSVSSVSSVDQNGLTIDARAVALHRLRVDVVRQPGDGLQLVPREHRRLIAVERRGIRRALAVREHRVRARLILAELDGEDPSVADRRREL